MKRSSPPWLFLGLLILGSLILRSEAQLTQTNENPSQLIRVQFPNSPIADIITFYEGLTGKRLVRDSFLASNATNLTIVSSRELEKPEAIRFIEAALLLNGFAIEPGPDDSLKIINTASGKNPRSEGVPLFANAEDLPAGDRLVSYYMPLKYIPSNQALAAFTAQATPHGYGSYIEVPHTQSLVLTENTSVIRQLIALKELIDVPPAQVVSEFIKLERADADRVSDAINKLLEAQRKNQAPPAAGSFLPASASGQLESQLVAGDTQIVSDPRTNRILVVTRPINMPFLKSLIEQFDQSNGLVLPLKRRLNYITALEVIPVIQDLLSETKDDTTKSATPAGATAPTATRTPTASASNSNTPGSSSQGSNSSSLLLPEPPDQNPTSVIVGKTKVVADVRSNTILVIGPPESIEKVRSLLDQMDQKPLQVYLATVVGKLTINGNSQLSVDLLQNFAHYSGDAGVATSSQNTSLLNGIRNPAATFSAANVFPAIAGTTVFGAVGTTLSYYVNALQSTGRFTVLARPSVCTANNKKAYISSGQQVPYPQSTLSNLDTTNNTNASVQATVGYQNVNLTLEVIPLINEKKEINLQVAQQNQSITGNSTISGNTVPIIANDTLVTTVTIPNKATLALGGLIRDSDNSSRTGVPWLSNIPVLGFFFRGDTRTRSRDELVVLIEPQVIETAEDLAAAQAREKALGEVSPLSTTFMEKPPVSSIKTKGKIPTMP